MRIRDDFCKKSAHFGTSEKHFFFGHSQSEGTKNLFVNNSGKHKVNKLSDDELHFGMDCVGLLTRVAFIHMPAMIGTYNQVPEFQNFILKLAISELQDVLRSVMSRVRDTYFNNQYYEKRLIIDY